jgi:A/G-specific adenine glycosylase
MELGAMVCIPGSPRCDECPLRDSCGALATGTVEERPARTAAKAVPVEHHGVAVVVADDSRVLLVKRPGKGRLAGLWEFPGVQSQPDETPADTAFRAYLTTTGEYSDQSTPVLTPLCTISHAFTHVRVVYQAFVLPISAADKANPAEPGPTEFIPSEKNASGDSSPIVTALSPKGSSSASSEHPGRAEPMVSAWVEFSAISSYPLPRAQQKIAAALLERVRG